MSNFDSYYSYLDSEAPAGGGGSNKSDLWSGKLCREHRIDMNKPGKNKTHIYVPIMPVVNGSIMPLRQLRDTADAHSSGFEAYSVPTYAPVPIAFVGSFDKGDKDAGRAVVVDALPPRVVNECRENNQPCPPTALQTLCNGATAAMAKYPAFQGLYVAGDAYKSKLSRGQRTGLMLAYLVYEGMITDKSASAANPKPCLMRLSPAASKKFEEILYGEREGYVSGQYTLGSREDIDARFNSGCFSGADGSAIGIAVTPTRDDETKRNVTLVEYAPQRYNVSAAAHAAFAGATIDQFVNFEMTPEQQFTAILEAMSGDLRMRNFLIACAQNTPLAEATGVQGVSIDQYAGGSAGAGNQAQGYNAAQGGQQAASGTTYAPPAAPPAAPPPPPAQQQAAPPPPPVQQQQQAAPPPPAQYTQHGADNGMPPPPDMNAAPPPDQGADRAAEARRRLAEAQAQVQAQGQAPAPTQNNATPPPPPPPPA